MAANDNNVGVTCTLTKNSCADDYICDIPSGHCEKCSDMCDPMHYVLDEQACKDFCKGILKFEAGPKASTPTLPYAVYGLKNSEKCGCSIALICSTVVLALLSLVFFCLFWYYRKQSQKRAPSIVENGENLIPSSVKPCLKHEDRTGQVESGTTLKSLCCSCGRNTMGSEYTLCTQSQPGLEWEPVGNTQTQPLNDDRSETVTQPETHSFNHRLEILPTEKTKPHIGDNALTTSKTNLPSSDNKVNEMCGNSAKQAATPCSSIQPTETQHLSEQELHVKSNKTAEEDISQMSKPIENEQADHSSENYTSSNPINTSQHEKWKNLITEHRPSTNASPENTDENDTEIKKSSKSTPNTMNTSPKQYSTSPVLSLSKRSVQSHNDSVHDIDTKASKTFSSKAEIPSHTSHRSSKADTVPQQVFHPTSEANDVSTDSVVVSHQAISHTPSSNALPQRNSIQPTFPVAPPPRYHDSIEYNRQNQFDDHSHHGASITSDDWAMIREAEQHPDRETFDAMKEFDWVQGFSSEGHSIEVYVDGRMIDQPQALAELVNATKESPTKFKIVMEE